MPFARKCLLLSEYLRQHFCGMRIGKAVTIGKTTSYILIVVVYYRFQILYAPFIFGYTQLLFRNIPCRSRLHIGKYRCARHNTFGYRYHIQVLACIHQEAHRLPYIFVKLSLWQETEESHKRKRWLSCDWARVN